MSGRVAAVDAVESNPDILYVGRRRRRRLEVGQRRRSPGSRSSTTSRWPRSARSPSTRPTRTSSGWARARATRATASRSATASTARSTAAGPGSTSGSRRPSASTASCSTRRTRTSPGSRPWASSGARTPSAASSRRPTAARPGSKVLYVDERTGAADLVIDPGNPNKLFAAMWQYRRWPWFFRSGGPGSGLYVTHDGGETWKRLHRGGRPAQGRPRPDRPRHLALEPGHRLRPGRGGEERPAALGRRRPHLEDGQRATSGRRPAAVLLRATSGSIPSGRTGSTACDYDVRVSDDGGKTFDASAARGDGSTATTTPCGSIRRTPTT